jgi:hypothetical protein
LTLRQCPWSTRRSLGTTLTRSAIAAIVLLALLVAPSAAPASAGGGDGVLVVGDSLEELTSPYLERYLPGVRLTVNAKGGYNSYQIFDLFKESYEPADSVIVFDAGTNDNPAYPQILAGNLNAVAETIGDRCMVVPTIHGFTVNGIDNDGKNGVVEEFAASRPGTQTPDWAGFVATHPELMQSDDLHPTPEGADYRARLIAQGIRACIRFQSPPPAPQPVLKSAPTLARPTRLAKRQSAMVRTIGAEMLRQVAAQLVRREPFLAAALAAASVTGGDRNA